MSTDDDNDRICKAANRMREAGKVSAKQFEEAAKAVRSFGTSIEKMQKLDADITVMSPVVSANGMKGRCYYYKGNFFQPMTIHPSYLGKMKKAKRQFMKDNAELIEKDRAHPEYKTLVELCDEQFLTSREFATSE